LPWRSEALSRLESFLAALQRFYGVLPAPPQDPFALFVREVLSVHATPTRRDAAFGALKRNRMLTPDAMWRAPQKKLQECVALAGPYVEQRLRALRTGVDQFRRSPDLPQVIKGPLAQARRALRKLPQMGEGGAYRMLLFAGGRPVLPVDAGVSRVARRLGYGSAQATFTRTARSVRESLGRDLPGTADSYRRAYLYLAHHGSATCAETNPHCQICPLRDTCVEGIRKLMNAD
jgi:endonuclease III